MNSSTFSTKMMNAYTIHINLKTKHKKKTKILVQFSDILENGIMLYFIISNISVIDTF